MDQHVEHIIWLCGIEGIGIAKANKIIKSFKDTTQMYNADPLAFAELGFLTRTDITRIFEQKYKEKAKKVIETVMKKGIKTVSVLDEGYPVLLKHIYDPPPVLYYKGEIGSDSKALAIVGARKATSYGISMAGIISSSLGKLGFTIVSGMARGIDTAAHEAAVRTNAQTYAVLGCGIDIVYPPENRRMYEAITEAGAVISEFVPGTEPFPYNFPQRNRIISGISMGVIVIEAGERSGSLITANIAMEQGREVFALPGNLISTRSVGTNKLIRDGAKIITGIEDIIDELSFFEGIGENKLSRGQILDKVLNQLSEEEKKVVCALDEDEFNVDELLNKTGLAMKSLNAVLVSLELNGLVEQVPGKIFRLIREF